MTKSKIIGVAAILLLATFTIFLFNRSRETVPVAPMNGQPIPGTTNASIDLLGEEIGVAMVAVDNGKATIQYGLIDAPQGIVQPAHVYSGTCKKLGELKYLLDAPVDGVSITALDVSLDELKHELPLAIAVNKSLEEIGTYVSCGDVVL